jgi:hypothetical protein
MQMAVSLLGYVASLVIHLLIAGPTRLLPRLAGEDFIFQWIGLMKNIPCYRATGVTYLPLS